MQKKITHTGILFFAAFLVLSIGMPQKTRAHIPESALDYNSFSTELTDAEKDWLNRHPVIRVAPDPDFPPIEWIDKDGHHVGIASDYLKIIQKTLPVKFEIVHLDNWKQCIRYAKERKIDMWAAAVPTAERLKYMRFTRPFVEFPAVILVRDDSQELKTIKDLKGKQVAVVQSYADHEYMIKNHPDVNIVVAPDIVSGLRLTSFGRVDAMVLNIASASYYISKAGITNLKVFKDSGFIFDLSFAVRKDWEPLQKIMDKAVASISKEDRDAVMNRWVRLKREKWRPTPLMIMGAITSIILLILLSFLISNRILRKQVHARTKELEHELYERIKAEEEKAELQQKINRSRKMEALGLLAGSVAHDLNNILSGIINYPQLILNKLEKDNPLRAPLKSIEDSGIRAAAVVDDLLTIARGVATTKTVQSLNDIVRAYRESPEFNDLASRFDQILFNINLAENLFNTSCSATHIRKSIMNLTINAAEAVGVKGTVTITTENCRLEEPVSGYESVKKGDYVLLKIIDTGPGIDKEDLEKIFEPFFTRKDMGKSGTGLGLSVVWNTVDDHLGYIDIATSPGRTVFKIFLPATRKPLLETVDASVIDHLSGKGETILVVDDEPLQRDLAVEMLQHLGYAVQTASSGEGAVTRINDTAFDLILLDMIMPPGMSGRETYKKISCINPHQKVVICSGYTATNDVKSIQSKGTGTFIKKPYSITDLGEAVRKELGK